MTPRKPVPFRAVDLKIKLAAQYPMLGVTKVTIFLTVRTRADAEVMSKTAREIAWLLPTDIAPNLRDCTITAQEELGSALSAQS